LSTQKDNFFYLPHQQAATAAAQINRTIVRAFGKKNAGQFAQQKKLLE